MDNGKQLNGTDRNIPCHRLNVNSFLLTDNPSALCFLLHFVLAFLSFITICGNLLVIISIIYFRQLHTPTNYLILSLAVTDLLVGFVVFPLTLNFSISLCWKSVFEKDLFCVVRSTFDISLCTSSILHLCCISIDRYYAVCQPLTYRVKITDNVVFLMISVNWTVSAFIGIGLTVLNLKPCGGSCFIVVLVNIMGLIFAFYAPMCVMLCIYFKIFFVAQKQARSIQGSQTAAMEKKATKTLATVMGLFLLCWLPFYICTTVISFSRGSYVPVAFFELLNWLALLNSTLNPFIYAFFYSWFRAAFRMIISGKIFIGNFASYKLQ